MLVTLNNLTEQKAVLERYQANYDHKVKNWMNFINNKKIYCEEAPKPEEIIWQNIGTGD